MKEVTETVDLTGAADLYPGVSKVTVDMPNRIAYVFIGGGNRATPVTGAEFDMLAKVMPAGGEDAPQSEDAPVEAVITVVAEEGAADKPAQSKRRKEN